MSDSEVKQSADTRIIEYLEAVLEAAKLGQICTYDISESRCNTQYVRSKTINLKAELLVTAPQNLYAFWEHEDYPFVLGGEVSSFTPDGRAMIPSYQTSVNPVLILPLAEGKLLQGRLDGCERVHKQREHDQKIEDRYALKVGFPELKKVFNAQ